VNHGINLTRRPEIDAPKTGFYSPAIFDGDPALATPEKGKTILEASVRDVAIHALELPRLERRGCPRQARA
jgi:creatinine amidohydrolase/Fe(II)-dependent formamide hydrolase-like protein